MEAKNQIQETLAQALTLPSKAEPSSKPWPDVKQPTKTVRHPLKNAWQQKWVALDAVHPKLQELADAAEGFCSRWYNHSTNLSLLVIVGNYGSGKTHTAKAIFRYCLHAAMASFEDQKWPGSAFPTCHFLRWPEVADEFGLRNYSSLTDSLATELLVIDDIGAESDPWKVCADKLCQILNRRERMFTVVTTNIQPTHWAERFDGRIADRLFRNSVIVDLSGVPSYSVK